MISQILLCCGCLFIIGNQNVSWCECNFYYFDNALNVSFCDCATGKQCLCLCIHTVPAENDGEEENENISE